MTVDWSEGHQAVVRFLCKQAGLSFQPQHRESVQQRIAAAMASAGCSSSAEFVKRLKSDPVMLNELLAATTGGETYFFRDLRQFRMISDLILADIRRRLGPGHKIRLWSAGCGSGEEAYSLAMLLHRRGALSQASILGTDISDQGLASARAAVYPEAALRDEGASMARPYLTQKNGQYHVNATMKKSVRFERLNLARDIYPSVSSGTRGMDLIFCRNILLYYDEETAHSIVSRLYRSLAEGGWLITGSDDPPIHEMEMFDFIPTEHGLAYRKANYSLVAAEVQAATEVSAAPDLRHQPAEPIRRETQASRSDGGEPANRSRLVHKAMTERTNTLRPLGSKRLAEAKQALALGEYRRAADLTSDLRGEGAIIHIKAMSSIDVKAAAMACQAATRRRPLSQELHYLNALLMMDLNRHREAAESLRRILFLDESLALVHFSLGTALRTLGDIEGAQQAFRSAVEICDRTPPDQHVPLGDDETAGQLRQLAQSELQAIE